MGQYWTPLKHINIGQSGANADKFPSPKTVPGTRYPVLGTRFTQVMELSHP